MKTVHRVASCFAALLLLYLTCVSAVRTLHSINDLKKIDFGQSVPVHSLLLLHWFANRVSMDNNNVISLTFNPNIDYGFHHYGNYERMLDPLPRGYRYYTGGNLLQRTSAQLPDYVLNTQRVLGAENRDRVIIRVLNQRIDQVYITQHYPTLEQQGALYDPQHTYQISSGLLRQIREFSLSSNTPLRDLRNRYESNIDHSYLKHVWGSLACLGLFLYIVMEGRQTSAHLDLIPRNNKRRQNNTYDPESNRHSNRWVRDTDEDSTNEDNIADSVIRVITNRLREGQVSQSRTCSCRAWAISFSIIVILAVIIVLLIRFLT